MKTVLSLENIFFKQGKNFSLSIEKLELEARQVYALTGPNGAGKSTLLRIMALLSLPQKGIVQLAGSDASSLSLNRQRVSLVEQSPYMFRGSVAENLSFGLKLRRVPTEEQQRRIKLILSIVGLEDFEHRKAKELSGGEMQRVALARALVFKPELLLLDEPTANIDRSSLSAYESLLGRLPKYGVTVVFSTHDMTQFQRLGAELLRIEDGHLVNLSRNPEPVLLNRMEN